MDPKQLILSILFFLAVAGLVMFLHFLYAESRYPKRRFLKKRLLYVAAGGGHGREKLQLYKESVLKNAGPIDRLFLSLPRVAALDRLLLRAGGAMSVSTFFLLSAGLGSLGLFLAVAVIKRAELALPLGAGLLLLPLFFLKLQEKDFFKKFEEQLPEAMDLLARALRVGHALSSGVEMVAEEMDDPIKGEFAAVADDVNLGLSVKEAFENMCERVPIPDLRFFAIAVLIQRETGGSLAQILDNIGRLIRERVQFRRKVKALTADGRVSMVILLGLPLLMFTYLYYVNYDYISLLWTERIGRVLLAAAACMQIAGFFVMRKMVNIEV